MQRIGMALNLEGHHVGEAEELIYLCGDIEGINLCAFFFF
jgi:hypothetical protein